jgi:hypothetical protein
MKSFSYAYAIANSHNDKKMNMFRMKKIKREIMSSPKEMNQRQVEN